MCIMVCYGEPVAMSHGGLFVPGVVNHGVFSCASGCESW